MDKVRRRSRLLPSIQQALIVQFVAGVPARTAAELSGVNRNTAILFFHKLREIIAENVIREAPFLSGEVEVDESYFGGVRKGKRGRGAGGKVPVFGLLKRGGRVYAVMIPDAKSQTLLGIMRQRIQPDSLVYTDSFRSYDVIKWIKDGIDNQINFGDPSHVLTLDRQPVPLPVWAAPAPSAVPSTLVLRGISGNSNRRFALKTISCVRLSMDGSHGIEAQLYRAVFLSGSSSPLEPRLTVLAGSVTECQANRERNKKECQ